MSKRLTLLAAFAILPCLAQQRTFTAADYARAERLMGYNTTALVVRTGVRPNWLPDEPLWSRVTTAGGVGQHEFAAVRGGDAVPKAPIGQPVGANAGPDHQRGRVIAHEPFG